MTGQPDVPAGARVADPSSRYELAATTSVRSGRSADPLGQAPVPTVNALQQSAAGRRRQEMLATTDTLGERPSASPAINPGGERGAVALARTTTTTTTLMRAASHLCSPFVVARRPQNTLFKAHARTSARSSGLDGTAAVRGATRLAPVCIAAPWRLTCCFYFPSCLLSFPLPCYSFADWRPTSSRARQPPGGQSNMSQIFG